LTGSTDAIKARIAQIGQHQNLSREASRGLFHAIMSGAATDAQIGAVLLGLKVKGESVDEIAGAAEAMRALSLHVDVDDSRYLIDTCGTGGSGGAKLFNVSTAAAFVAAAAGAHVAKHGNRAMTSKSGSADVLEAAGVRLDLTPQQIARCIRDVGVGFMFAPVHHGAMKHAAAARRELGTRTILNMLGPLTNPAGAPNQVIGVAAPEWLQTLAEVLAAMGSRHVLLVHADGLDELSLAGPSEVVELRHGTISRYRVAPEDFGIERAPLDELRADSPVASLELIRRALGEPDSVPAQIVALNAGAAIYASGVATTFANGVTMAQDALAAGLAEERFTELVRITSLMMEPE
jgi:anthranilate phosphoribosyltransferase